MADLRGGQHHTPVRACSHERRLALGGTIIHPMEGPALSAIADEFQQRQVALICHTKHDRVRGSVGIALIMLPSDLAGISPVSLEYLSDVLRLDATHVGWRRSSRTHTCCMHKCIPGTNLVQPGPWTSSTRLHMSQPSQTDIPTKTHAVYTTR